MAAAAGVLIWGLGGFVGQLCFLVSSFFVFHSKARVAKLAKT